jgi:hypothetical protein
MIRDTLPLLLCMDVCIEVVSSVHHHAVIPMLYRRVCFCSLYRGESACESELMVQSLETADSSHFPTER